MTAPTAFEDEVRAMLARRADDIAPDAVSAALPTGVRIALVDERPSGRPPWLAAAAALLVVVALAALLRTADGTDEEATVRLPTETSAPAAPASTAVLPGLPAGIGVAHLLTLWDPGAEGADLDPTAVAEAYLADRIGPTASATVLPEADADLVSVRWGIDEEWVTPLGSVHLERRDGRWQVIAATTETFDVTGARLADGRLQGTMANTGTDLWGVEIGPADLTASVQDLAGMVLGMPQDCPSPCEQDTGTYIAQPELVAAGGSTVPVELAPIGEPLAEVPHRLQAVVVRDGAELTGGEEPQVTMPPAGAFAEIVFDPTVRPIEPAVPPSDSGGDRPEHLASLPLGIDPTVGPVRSIESWGASPEAAAEDLGTELGTGDRLTDPEPISFPGADPDGLWAGAWSSLVPLDRAAWPGDHADGIAGTVTARRHDGGGWTTVAATSAALDLTDVRYTADGGLRGEVRASVPAPIEVTVTTAEGEELVDAHLTTDADPQGPSTMVLDDLLERTDGRPLLLQVALGDRPGQVGLGGVEVATFARVVLPGWTDEADASATTAPADTPDVPTATTEAELRGDEAVLWRGTLEDVGGEWPRAAITYVADVLGVAGAVAVDEPPSASASDLDGVVRLPGGEEVVVRLAWRGDEEWRVLEVGGGGLEVSATGVTSSAGPLPGEQPGWTSRYVLTYPTGEIGSFDELPPASDLRGATGVVVVASDPEGKVRDVRGNPV